MLIFASVMQMYVSKRCFMNIYCIINPVQVLLSLTVTVLLLKNIFGYEFRPKKIPAIIVAGMSAVLNAGLSCLTTDPEMIDLIAEASTFCLTMFFPYLIFRYQKRFTFLKFGFVLCATFDFIVFSIWSPFTDRALIIYRLLYCLIYTVAIAVILMLSKKVENLIPYNFLDKIPTLIYIVIFIADLSAFYDVSSLFDSEYSVKIAGILKLFSSALVVICIVAVALKYSKEIRLRKESDDLLESQLRHYEDIMEKNRKLREFRHDYRNNLFAINALLNKSEVEEAKEYISGMNDTLDMTYSRFMTGNFLADAILTEKAIIAENKGIKLDFDGKIPHNLIANNDLCTILANAIDNAIRGAEGCSDAKIIVSSHESDGALKIIVRNTVLRKVEIKDNTIKTTKSDSDNHGFGLNAIKAAAHKYDGFMVLDCDDRYFTLKTILFLKGDGNE